MIRYLLILFALFSFTPDVHGFVVAGSRGPVAAADFCTTEGWDCNQYFEVAIAASDFDTSETQFPVTIFLGLAVGKTDFDATAIFDELGANSLKFAIVDSSDTQLYVEIESWDHINETAVLHTSPDVSSSAGETLRLYYDSTHADNSDYVGVIGSTPGRLVWDDYFDGVWHKTEDPSGAAPQMINSKADQYHGTSYGTMTTGDLVDGLHSPASALDYDNSNDFVEVGVVPTAQAMTVEAFIYPDTVSSSDGIVIKRHASGSSEVSTERNCYLFSVSAFGVFAPNGSTFEQVLPPSAISAVEWTHVAGRASQAGGLHYFKNGVGNAGALTIESFNNHESAVVQFGIKHGNISYRWFDGLIDEVRISNVARSDTWIAASNLSLRDTLLTISAP